MTSIAIVLYEGFDELDAIGPFEVFRNAADRGADLDAALVTVEETSVVTASHGLRIEPDGTLPASDDPDRPDIVVVPGGGWSSGESRGVRREYERGTIPDVVAAHHEAGATVAAVCTGAMLLARAGLTDGRPAVTHGSALDDLRASGAEVVDARARVVDNEKSDSSGRTSGPAARVVDDGDLLTAGGVTSGLDLALHLVEREADADVADEVATVIEYERRHEVVTG